MDINHWLSKLVAKWSSANLSFHEYTKLPSMVSELPSLLPSQRTSRTCSFRSLRTMRQAIIIGCLLLVITIAALFHTLNSSFTLHGFSEYKDPQYLSNLEYCRKYSGREADVNKIFATLTKHIPPEDQREGLLTQPDGTGAALTHNTALKAREYLKLFEPWAEVHLSLGADHSLHSREDVVQYLHCQASALTKVTNMNESQLLQVIQLYDAYRHLVTNMGQTLFPWTAPYFPDHLSLYSQIRNGGKGIVFTTGNNQVSYILTSIVTIRKLGCNLPIEVMYNGAEDLNSENRRKIESFPGVITRNLEHMIQTGNDGWKFEGFDMKPFAILVSSFREAILVDADVGFLKNPESLFHDPGYMGTGTLFFYDRIHSRNEQRTDWLRMVMPEPLSGRVNDKIDLSNKIDATREDQESGVVLFDKSRHLISLLMIAWLNGPYRHGNGEETENKGFYDLYYGDKDSYWFGMELTGNPNYSFSTGSLAATGNLTKIVQYTFDQKTKDAIKIEEYAYNSSFHAADTHLGRTISVYDRDLRVCSYQMVHMDRDQSPLWYNGWISDQKKPSLSMKNVWEFENYMLEPEVNGHNPWSWLGGFKGCLDGRELVSYTKSEKAVFQDAIQAGIDLGVVNTDN